MDNPLVSIITITRNRGTLIGRCIASVLGQTYKNIEYIIVDGASDDDTDEVVSSFNDSRLRYVKLETNWPIVDTINYGVDVSSGEYISFLDSDDEYHLDKIEKQVSLIECLPADYGMVYCWMTYYDNNTLRVDHIHNPMLKGDVSKDVVARPTVSGTPTFLFKREAFLSDGRWKSKQEIGLISDWEMAARFCQKWKVDYVPESLVNVYVNHNVSRMSTKDYYQNYYEQKLQFHNYFLNAFKDIFDEDPRKESYHLMSLTASNIKLHRWKDALSSYRRLLRLDVSLKEKLSVLASLIKKPN